MRIVYVGNFNRLSVGEPEVAAALEALGHKVYRYEESTAADELLTEVAQKKPDFFLFAKLRVGNFGDVSYLLKKLRALGVPSVCWLFDLYVGYGTRNWQVSRNPIFKADIVFSTDGGHQKEFHELGVNHFLLRQGCDESEIRRGNPTFDVAGAEIGFVGSVSGSWTYRRELVEFLKRRYGDRFRVFGQKSEIRHDDLLDLFASLKIVIGDSVKSPRYWSNRLYETLGKGGFLIFPRIDGLEKEYRPYKHFVPYHYGDFKALETKIDYFLERPEERKAIVDAALEETRKRHTYRHRVEELLRILRRERILT